MSKLEISRARQAAKPGVSVLPESDYGTTRVEIISKIAETAALLEGRLPIYSGNDDQIIPVLSLGGKGVISVLSHVIPKETHNMVQYCLDNNLAEATKLQIDYLDLINNLFIEVNPIPVKEAMNMMGMNVGECRLPLYKMTDAARETLYNTLAKHGLVK